MIINLTPHTIRVQDKTFEPSGTISRCREATLSVGEFEGIKLIRRTYGSVIDLPDSQPDTLYIVSMLVREALPERTDLASPGTLIRDENGQIIGAENLIVN